MSDVTALDAPDGRSITIRVLLRDGLTDNQTATAEFLAESAARLLSPALGDLADRVSYDLPGGITEHMRHG